MSRMKELKLAKAKQEDATDPKSNNKRSRDLRNKCYNTNQPASASCWDISELIGYNGMDVKEVWDALAHNPDKMIEEVEMKFAIINWYNIIIIWAVLFRRPTQYQVQPSGSLVAHLHLKGQMLLV